MLVAKQVETVVTGYTISLTRDEMSALRACLEVARNSCALIINRELANNLLIHIARETQSCS